MGGTRRECLSRCLAGKTCRGRTAWGLPQPGSPGFWGGVGGVSSPCRVKQKGGEGCVLGTLMDQGVGGRCQGEGSGHSSHNMQQAALHT